MKWLTILIILITYANNSQANENKYAKYKLNPTFRKNYIHPKLYFGIDTNFTKINHSSKFIDIDISNHTNNEFTTLSFITGIKLNPYLAIELYYLNTNKKQQRYESFNDITNYLAKLTTQYKSTGLDTILHLPLNSHFDLLGILGFGWYEFENKNILIAKGNPNFTSPNYSIANNNTQNTIAIRLGIGGQYYITKNLALRATAKYIYPIKNQILNNIKEYSFGIRYIF